MNKVRKNKIIGSCEKIEVEIVKLKNLLDEEETAHNNTPDSLCDTDAYADSENAIDVLTDAIDAMDSAVNDIKEM